MLLAILSNMATKTLLTFVFLATLSSSYAQIYKYPPSNTVPPSYYLPPKYPTPSYPPPASYPAYGSQQTYYQPPAPSKPPATYYYQPPATVNRPPTYPNLPPPTYRNYPNPQPPQYYGSMYYTQPSYNTNSYATYKNCTDQTCASNECCEFNGRNYVCVPALTTGIAGADSAAVCARYKRCYSTSDCPTGHCCVVRLDMLNAGLNSYGSNYNMNYNINYGNGNGYNYKIERGECVLAGEDGDPCRRTVDSATSTCPCGAGLTCQFAGTNLLTGECD